MKIKYNLWWVFLGIFFNNLYALDASIAYSNFITYEGQPYTEIYMYMAAKTLKFMPLNDSIHQAQIEVIVQFQQNNKIIKADKFELKSPLVKKEYFDMGLLEQKRYTLEAGIYQLVVQLKDKNDEKNLYTESFELTIKNEKNDLQMSSIQLVEKVYLDTLQEHPFCKNGYYLKPKPLNYFSQDINTLSFYMETYNGDRAKGEEYYIKYYIEKEGKAGVATDNLGGVQRQTSKKLHSLAVKLNISDIPSGKYKVVAELRNKKHELISKQTADFYRNNPMPSDEELADVRQLILENTFVEKMSEEEVHYHIRTLTPIANPNESLLLKNVLHSKEHHYKKQFLLGFWTRRNKMQPEAAFSEYKQQVDLVNKNYSTAIEKGFSTDRGYIFLKYGVPNHINKSDSEIGAYPYEVWEYARLHTQQANVKFIFYNPSLAPNDYVILHSTARGEINNPAWKRELYRNKARQGNNIDNKDFDTNAEDFFRE